MKVVKTKRDKNGEYFLDLKEILKGTTTKVRTVKFYNLNKKKDGSIIVTLFNKSKRKN